MLIERIWINNRLRNYNYLIACADTGEALALDPLVPQRCTERAQQRGWEITQILNTHEHPDHTAGNVPLMNITGAPVLAHHAAEGSIPGMSHPLRAGDRVRIGSSVEMQVLDTPGHTRTHVCLLGQSDTPVLFCGDTLFNAGVGNCHNGGHPEALYRTFSTQLAQLDEATRIYPGHDYMVNNLEFTLDREPGNAAAAELLASVRSLDPEQMPITTLAQEKQINTFFRLRSPELIDRLREVTPQLGEAPTDEAVFLRLRELRNVW